MSINDTLNRIRAFAREPGNSKAALAVKAGVHRNSLLGIDAPDWSPNVDTLRKLESVIPADFFPAPADSGEAA